MRLFKTRWFARFARKARMDDASLVEAIERAERGLIDADLGGGLIKQRVARLHEGRSGGYRTIVGYRRGERAVFLYGFAKNERDNVRQGELESLREVGAAILDADAAKLQLAIEQGRIEEVEHEDEQ